MTISKDAKLKAGFWVMVGVALLTLAPLLVLGARGLSQSSLSFALLSSGGLFFGAVVMYVGFRSIYPVLNELKRERELSVLKSRLVSMVGHEFSNALNIIQGSAHVLRVSDSDPSSAKRAGFYDMLENSARALTLLVNNLLDLGRLESGGFPLDLKPLDAGTLVRGAHETMQFIAQRKNLRATLEAPPGPLAVVGDAGALSLVLLNLLGNAVKYTPENGEIAVGARPSADDPSRAEIFVRDTGIGIPPQEQEKIFLPYYRAAAGKAMAHGLGLGLHLVKQMLDAHGSALRVESAVGRGSRFSFTLPIHGSLPPAGGPSGPARPARPA